MTKTTPGAMRAAKAIQQDKDQRLTNKHFIHELEIPLLAEMIDEHSGGPAMLEALQALMDEYKQRMDGDYPGENLHQFQSAYRMARAAISAATGEGKIG